jgi:hypothetical protein
VDYVLSEAHASGIERVVAAVRPYGQETRLGVMRDKRFDWDFVETSGSGTFDAVVRLTAAIGAETHLISTCDVILPVGTISRLCAAAEFVNHGTYLMLLVTESGNDSAPIGIELDQSGHYVVALGKDLLSTQWVFGSVRWVSAAFADFLAAHSHTTLRDTKYLGWLVSSYARSVAAHPEHGIFDVDTLADLERANMVVRLDERYSRNNSNGVVNSNDQQELKQPRA